MSTLESKSTDMEPFDTENNFELVTIKIEEAADQAFGFEQLSSMSLSSFEVTQVKIKDEPMDISSAHEICDKELIEAQRDIYDQSVLYEKIKSECVAEPDQVMNEANFEDLRMAQELKPCVKVEGRNKDIESLDIVHEMTVGKPTVGFAIIQPSTFEIHEMNNTNSPNGSMVVKLESTVASDFCETELQPESTDNLNESICLRRTIEQRLSLPVNKKQTLEKSFKCGFCNSCYVSKRNLSLHVARKHDIEKPFECHSCSCSFVTKKELTSHEARQHDLEKPFHCSFCSRSFVFKHELAIHMARRHTLEKPFHCEFCSCCFGTKHDLANHVVRQHILQKPFQCRSCSRSFVSKRNLTIHEARRHTLKKPFQCKSCSCCFGTKHDLANHVVRQHTLQKPSQCSFCSFSFATKKELTSHEARRHTLEKPFQCGSCSYSCVTNYELSCHVARKHRTLEESSQCGLLE